MREKTNENGAGTGDDPRGCDRGEELVAYLYGEAAPEEDADFRRHLAACAACAEELAALGGLREELAAWREEALRSLPPLRAREAVASAATTEANAAVAGAGALEVETKNTRPLALPARRRSASAALHGFFSLSPAWLRVGAAAAVAAFCALAVLTLARAQVRWDSNGFTLTTGGATRVVERQPPVSGALGFTQEQVDALVRQRVEREVGDARARWEAEVAARGTGGENAVGTNAGGGADAGEGERAGLVRRASPARGVAVAGQKAARRTPRSAARGEQLADNVDDFNAGEESVPRLIDILGAVKSPGKTNEQ